MNHQETADACGLRVQLIETWRDNAGQSEAWAKGRNKAGEIIDRAKVVTYARPGHSWHNIMVADKPASLAYHLAIIRPGGLLGFGQRLTKPGELMYEALGFIGENLGMKWGGRWESLRDYTHFEFHPDQATLSQTIAAIKASGNIFRGQG